MNARGNPQRGMDMEPLTRRQVEILGYLREYLEEKGYAPSHEEVAERFGYRAISTVAEHLNTLQEKGYILRTPGRSRALRLLRPGDVAEPEPTQGFSVADGAQYVPRRHLPPMFAAWMAEWLTERGHPRPDEAQLKAWVMHRMRRRAS